MFTSGRNADDEAITIRVDFIVTGGAVGVGALDGGVGLGLGLGPATKNANCGCGNGAGGDCVRSGNAHGSSKVHAC